MDENFKFIVAFKIGFIGIENYTKNIPTLKTGMLSTFGVDINLYRPLYTNAFILFKNNIKFYN